MFVFRKIWRICFLLTLILRIKNLIFQANLLGAQIDPPKVDIRPEILSNRPWYVFAYWDYRYHQILLSNIFCLIGTPSSYHVKEEIGTVFISNRIMLITIPEFYVF